VTVKLSQCLIKYHTLKKCEELKYSLFTSAQEERKQSLLQSDLFSGNFPVKLFRYDFEKSMSMKLFRYEVEKSMSMERRKQNACREPNCSSRLVQFVA
jgi:hypothetical protein